MDSTRTLFLLFMPYFLVMPGTLMAQDLSWNLAGSLPVEKGLSGMVAGVSNGALIVAGGSNFSAPILQGGTKVFYDDIYVATDLAQLNWRHAGKLPKVLANSASVCVGGGILVMGGTDGSSVSDDVFFLAWDETTQRITIDSSFPRLPYPVESLSATCLQHTVYVAGGNAADGKSKHNFWKLKLEGTVDIPRAQWEEMPPWPGAERAGSVLVGYADGVCERIYLFGGKGTQYYSDAYAYDPQSNTWKILAPLPRPAYFSHAVTMGAAQIAVFSGSDGHNATQAIAMQDNYHMPKDVLSYHTLNNEWFVLGDMPVGVAGAGIVKRNNQILIIGGELRPGIRTGVIQIGALQTDFQGLPIVR
ncbi:Kelch repeat-containing protein [Parapedobacter sp. 10938]|uniref:Kelch repeat-containing protein n=1 Tax=Parapedobacter flavus TaxID=3110225 RepID=UPI002DBF8F86|nr:kelch repeat-containing protein [Parapedobacter sp. 10938]MEC3878965.1 kelch repeat-containing protein [Parapedobacter sp. 10938]